MGNDQTVGSIHYVGSHNIQHARPKLVREEECGQNLIVELCQIWLNVLTFCCSNDTQIRSNTHIRLSVKFKTRVINNLESCLTD